MAKYIVTEEQKKLLDEIYVVPGKYDYDPVQRFFKEIILPKMRKSEKKIISLTKMFFKKELWKSFKEVDGDFFYRYLMSIEDKTLSGFPKIMRKSSTLVSLAHYLATNLLQLNEFEGLKYYKSIHSPYHSYYFFDSEIDEFVGYMELQKALSLPGNSLKVNLSSVEKEYIGRGYGSRMYLCVINQVDYLQSDDTLYPDSLNMWVNYLPKKIFVWAKLNEGGYVQLTPNNFVSSDRIDKLIASAKKTKPPRNQ